MFTDTSKDEKAKFTELFNRLLRGCEEGKEYSSRKSRDSSSMPESASSPAPIQNGFFTPFDGFSSDLAHPQYHPDELSPSVTRINVFSEKEVEVVMKGLDMDLTREKVRGLIDAFIDDTHSSGVGLVFIEPSHGQPKTLFFKK